MSPAPVWDAPLERHLDHPGHGQAVGGQADPPPLPRPADAHRPIATPAPARSTGRGTVVVVGILSAVIASLVTGLLFVVLARSPETTTGGPSEAGAAASPGTLPGGAQALDIHGLLDRAQPSVVTIRTDTSGAAGKQPLAAGSGVIISEDGLVLTNAHVISGASAMKVVLFDGTVKPAVLVGTDPESDVAIVKITDPPTLTPAVLGSSADMEVGDPVIAIGNALNLGGSPSVTQGIVSGKDRDIQTKDGTLTNLIQTDAAINPGNSGGPLLNAEGQVVGINTAIIDNAQNVGFAIAIDGIKAQIEDLKAGTGVGGATDDAFLGVSTQSLGDVTDAALQRYNVIVLEGAFISDVIADSGAAAAGLQPGDVIIGIDGAPITSAADVGRAISGKQAGMVVQVVFQRAGLSKTVSVTLRTRAATGN